MQSPPPTPEQLQRDKEDRLRQVAVEMQPEIDKALREDQAEWLASTGRPMPLNIDQMVIEALAAGLDIEVIECRRRFDYEELGRQLSAVKIREDREDARRIAVGVEVARQAAAVTSPSDGDSDRIARNLTAECRKVLAAIHEWGASALADSMTRTQIEERTGLSTSCVRNVMERQLPCLDAVLVETKKGPGGGVWLTPGGQLVAAKIEKTVLPSSSDRMQKKSIR